MKHSWWLLALTMTMLSACEIWPFGQKNRAPETTDASAGDSTFTIEPIYQLSPYRAAHTKVWELHHTKLDLAIDWKNEHLLGEAEITLSPYNLYKPDTLVLDAKAMELHMVESWQNGEWKEIAYDYRKQRNILINLSRKMGETDTLKVRIKYTACPACLDDAGLLNSYDQYGLYFINADGSDNQLPTQLWTQGETGYNSTWFPTIDQPNMRMTQEISITVDTPFLAISNGRLVYMLINPDGSRTYKWKMDQSHPPYLAMLGVGKFAKIEDQWRDSVEVDYYVDPEYAKDAKRVFGKTPQMMEFFSEKFGVDYPWDKYAQLVVHEFVAGAMENTTASLFSDYLHRDSFAYNDASYENYVAHELAHQWFGNMVTCESWAHLTLNEGFATYSELLWREHAYNQNAAADKLLQMREKYFITSSYNAHPLVHHRYQHADDMFDAHSYEKGAIMLHALRNKLGDELFFAGLNRYLTDNAFSSVDLSHWQQALEKECGCDLSEFFSQWYLSEGHPVLEVEYHYVDSTNSLVIALEQNQTKTWGMFALNTVLHVDLGERKLQIPITINQSRQQWTIPLSNAPNWVCLDPEMHWPLEQNITMPTSWWIAQLQAPLATTRAYAWNHFYDNPPIMQGDIEQILKAFSAIESPCDNDQEQLVGLLERDWNTYQRVYPKAKEFLLSSQNTYVVGEAVELFTTAKVLGFDSLTLLWNRPSYVVKGAVVKAMVKSDYQKAKPFVQKALDLNHNNTRYITVMALSQYGDESASETLWDVVKSDLFYFDYLCDFFSRQDDAYLRNNLGQFDELLSIEMDRTKKNRVLYELNKLKENLLQRAGKEPNNWSTEVGYLETLMGKIAQK